MHFPMLIEFQFPLTDVRSVLAKSIRLKSPTWPFPRIGEEFIHYHGQVMARLGGGVADWTAEDAYCRAARGVRLIPPLPQQRIQLRSSVAVLEGAFRRLFCDGRLLVRYEIALGTAISDFHLNSQEDCLKFVDGCCGLSVRLPGAQASLATTGTRLAQEYLSATTPSNKRSVAKTTPWLVSSGMPLLLLSYQRGDVEHVEDFTRFVLGFADEAVIRHCWIRHKGQTISTWFLEKSNGASDELIRRVRVHLLRVHAERECLKNVFRLIVQGKIIVPRRSKKGDVLQDYLRQSLSFLSRTRSYGIWKSGILETLQEFEDIVSPGQRQTLLKELSRIRGNIRRQVERFTASQARATSDISVNNGATLVIGTNYFAQQVGAMGPNAHAHDMSFNQLWNEEGPKINLRELGRELVELRTAMRKVAKTTKHDIAVAEIAAAEQFTLKGAGPAAFSHLRNSGRWALTIARRHHLDVAASVIASSLKRAAVTHLDNWSRSI